MGPTQVVIRHSPEQTAADVENGGVVGFCLAEYVPHGRAPSGTHRTGNRIRAARGFHP